MKKQIEQSVERFFAEIQIDNWFANVGNFPADTQVFRPFLVEKIDTVKGVATNIDSIAWENFDLDTRNALFAFATHRMNHFDTDDLTMMAVKKLNLHKSVLNQKIREKQLPDDVFNYVLLGIVMSAFMEFYMQEQHPKMPIDVNRNLLKILNLGYLPCGWQPKKETPQEAYDPINFITDSLQTSKNQIKPFDYQSGILFIF